MDTTTRDFWKVVYDRKCSAIVMLSKLSEVSHCVAYIHTGTHRDTQTMVLIACCSIYLEGTNIQPPTLHCWILVMCI